MRGVDAVLLSTNSCPKELCTVILRNVRKICQASRDQLIAYTYSGIDVSILRYTTDVIHVAMAKQGKPALVSAPKATEVSQSQLVTSLQDAVKRYHLPDKVVMTAQAEDSDIVLAMSYGVIQAVIRVHRRHIDDFLPVQDMTKTGKGANTPDDVKVVDCGGDSIDNHPLCASRGLRMPQEVAPAC